MSTLDLTGAVWRKSSRSTGNSECVEVASVWRKSSRSAGNSACVEVAAMAAAIAVRDSKNPDGAVLAFAPGAFSAFTETLKTGVLDR